MLFNKTRQYNINVSIKTSFSSIGHDKSKLQKQISKLHILTAVTIKISNLFICFCNLAMLTVNDTFYGWMWLKFKHNIILCVKQHTRVLFILQLDLQVRKKPNNLILVSPENRK